MKCQIPLRRPRVSTLVATISVAAVCWRLLVNHTPLTPLVFNISDSLPYRVGWLHRGCYSPARGDFVVYAFNGPAVRMKPGLQGQPFFKKVAGVAGDIVQVSGQQVFINSAPVGVAKTHTHDGKALRPTNAGPIPDGFFYAQGMSADSFDSRYLESGLVPITNVIGRVTPLF
ncbi:conjugative transfer signal peptidase TraF [Massilia arenosa]|uniref:Conjugative transfer signal peptidase TraF n=1 Tax=Zemynaea arenosa TaxID=2561931 RepID=A0A4Y9S1G0_9BURK|nr:conjugative transfer signal peptidase TraF [Massilia arenosa]TFW13388.1 conjugative transfer signal peptidase TraF [Massilia arenosa]